MFKILFTLNTIIKLLIISWRKGHIQSSFFWNSADQNGNPLPWYTYPCIEYLEKVDFSDANIFEFGSGNSTLWWEKKAKQVTSVESDSSWYKKISVKLDKKTTYLFANSKPSYLNALEKTKQKFDVIIVDGKYRKECLSISVKKISKQGIIILDNSDWYKKEVKKFVKETNMIPVSFKGFGPINGYEWETTIFFKRNFNQKFNSVY